ncbi:TetR/AcrR family transcriptional regulator [Streptomyces olivochromogenes]|nr:TetR/AcrR family transcriptional regulator [Streptomyces olivochromogenes]
MSPRERILATAAALFYRRGIQATGIDELAEVAGVSKRTLYKLFGSKDELVAAYLERMDEDAVPSERPLQCLDLPPRDRLLALFDRPPADAIFRGCPFHNAAVELAGSAHPAHPVIHAHKHAVLDTIIDAAREAGADDPEALGHQLFVLFEGATALATSIDSTESFDYARPVAVALIDQTVPVVDAA